MLVHIGNGRLVRDRDVIGFFDLDGSVTPADTSDFLKKAEKDGRCASAALDLPRSFVLKSKADGISAGMSVGGNKLKRGYLSATGRLKSESRGDEVILTHISSVSLAGRANKRISGDDLTNDGQSLKKTD